MSWNSQGVGKEDDREKPGTLRGEEVEAKIGLQEQIEKM